MTIYRVISYYNKLQSINLNYLQLNIQNIIHHNISPPQQPMPHRHIQKALFYMVNFIKQTSLKHKKKLVTLVVIALLTYIAKRKLRLAHLITLAEHLTKIISYLPLPEFPTYRQLNRYESPKLNTLAAQIIQAIKVDQIRQKIKQHKGTWQQLKSSIFSGLILSLMLYNIQSFYFVVQNKYQKDFLELQAIETFDQLMGGIRKKFLTQIASSMEYLTNLLSPIIDQILVRQQYSIDEYFSFIDSMVSAVFDKKFILKKQPNLHVSRNIYQNEEAYNIAKNYFMTPLNYIPKKKSSLSKIVYKISSLTSRFSFNIFNPPVCQISQQRFEWTKVAYQIPFKKSLTDNLKWPNRESQLLSKLVVTQMDQILTSINLSTLLYKNAQYNTTVLKNRLFLYFSKKGLTKLKGAESLVIFYKLIKQELLVPGTHGCLKDGEQSKRERFYQSQILKGIRQKSIAQSQVNTQPQLLIRSQNPQNSQQYQQGDSSLQEANPQLIVLNMHLQEIYMSRQLNHLARQFQIKYFNQRSGVTLNPMQRKIGVNEQDEMKKLLNMLGDNEELNRKQDEPTKQTK